jgi:hypothetical protein
MEPSLHSPVELDFSAAATMILTIGHTASSIFLEPCPTSMETYQKKLKFAMAHTFMTPRKQLNLLALWD